ncbi:MAG TPA: ABC transporter substrate-binding protein [Xanthobacteraceae bacterium]|nr:ABC transporter substrate-binding protein [Xanthobacteraceae bacterium]
MKIVIPDLVSNSYFPAVAAVELGYFAREGLDVELELVFPVNRSYEWLRDGEADFVGGSAHSVLAAFPEWRGAKLLGALAQGMYWFLVMRADLRAKRGDLSAVKGRRIGAAPWVDFGLKQLLKDAGIDVQRDQVEIAPVPGSTGAGVSFGVNAAKALEEGKVDGFWANGMGAEVAVRRGVGTIVLDVRRGDGPKAAFGYTFPALVTTAALVEHAPDQAAAAVRALVKTQAALKANVKLATEVGRKWFPEFEASLIADVVERDLPFYDASISRETFDACGRFSRAMGLAQQPAAYEAAVAVQFGEYWKQASR